MSVPNSLRKIVGSWNGRGVEVRGTYAAPPGPDWSWRTTVETRGDSEFSIVMDNITPEGEEARAFENRYLRG